MKILYKDNLTNNYFVAIDYKVNENDKFELYLIGYYIDGRRLEVVKNVYYTKIKRDDRVLELPVSRFTVLTKEEIKLNGLSEELF